MAAEEPKIEGISREERAPEFVGEHRLPSPLVLHEAVRVDGTEQLSRGSAGLMWSGFAGGLTMGLSLLGAGLLHAHLPDARWRVLLTGVGFTLGFVVIMVGRQGLITENTLTGVLPVLSGNARVTAMLRLWGLTLAGNLVAAALFSLVAATSPVFSPETKAAFTELGRIALEPGFAKKLLGAIMAGWMIALALWGSPGAGPARIFLVLVLTWIVGVSHMGHIITGSIESLSAVFAGAASFSEYLRHFFLPVLLGNIIGGSVFVAAVNHLQIRGEREKLLHRHERRRFPVREEAHA